MAEAVEQVRATAEQRGIKIALVEPEPPVTVIGDRRQLVSALHALLENAVTYSYEGTTVTVTGSVHKEPVGDTFTSGSAVAGGATTASATVAGTISSGGGPDDAGPARTPLPAGDAATTGEWRPPTGPANDRTTSDDGGTRRSEVAHRYEPRECVRLSVADHGVGIPARDLDRIFERFYRVDHGRSRTPAGPGLGLSIVRHVASNHQGWVEVESREGEGSTFTLVLPLQPESEPVNDPRRRRRRRRPAGQRPLGRGRGVVRRRAGRRARPRGLQRGRGTRRRRGDRPVRRHRPTWSCSTSCCPRCRGSTSAGRSGRARTCRSSW